ncbi:transporter, putative [Minicystis rosea]|nr:transporter, putative [Minicystis rosea]
MGYLELLRSQPAFRRLWLGQVVSEVGDWLQFIALVGLFPTTGRAAEALAGLFIVRMLPTVLWAPLAGVVADRYPRGRVMVICDLLRALCVLGYLFVRGPEDVWLVYALVFVQESLTSFFEPARAAALPQVVERRALLAANSLAGATWSSMLAIGSALGGLVTLLVGPRGAFIVDSLSFLLSAILIAGVPIPRVEPAADAAPPARDPFGLHALREGARYLKGHRPQAVVALAKGLWGLSGGVVFLYAVYAAEVFTPKGGESARALGILYAGRGVGALVGPLVLHRILGESARSLRWSVQVGFVLAAIGVAALISAHHIAAGALFLVVAHAGGSANWVCSTQLLQITVPNPLQGRVFAVEQGAFTLTMAISSGVAGALIGRGITSLHGATLVLAAVAAASGFSWWIAMRRLGTRLEAAAADHEPLLPSSK